MPIKWKVLAAAILSILGAFWYILTKRKVAAADAGLKADKERIRNATNQEIADDLTKRAGR